MERDYDKTLRPIITPLVENPDAIIIRALPGTSKRDVTVLIVSDDDDTARLIGRHGMVANALREVISIAGRADETNIRVHLKFESFGDDNKEETVEE